MNENIIQKAILMTMGDDEFLVYKLLDENILEENYKMKKRNKY